MPQTEFKVQKRWREPDAKTKDYAVWYGPGGKEGEHATEIERRGSSYTISEYTFVGEGYFDEPPPAPFLKITTELRSKKPMSLRDAVDVGTQIIAYYGGEEEFVEELP